MKETEGRNEAQESVRERERRIEKEAEKGGPATKRDSKRKQKAQSGRPREREKREEHTNAVDLGDVAHLLHRLHVSLRVEREGEGLLTEESAPVHEPGRGREGERERKKKR